MSVLKYRDPTSGKWKVASSIIMNTGLDATVGEYSQMNEKVTAYLKAAEVYTDTNTDMTVMSDHLSLGNEWDDPVGKVITIDKAGTLYVLDENTGSSTKSSVRAGEQTIYNLIPGHVYQWFVKDSSGVVVSSGRVRPTGAVRMLKFLYSGIRNLRDLGGWKCDGGTIKYNRIIRGGFFGDKEADAENRKLAEDIGIKHEVDLRDEATATSSPIGKHVHYYRCPISAYYANIVDQSDKGSYNSIVKALRTIFDAVNHDECCYYHCSLGADRAGTVSWMIEALLGMSRADMDKDYELTTFYVYQAQSGTRYRTRTDYRALKEYLPTFDDVVLWYLRAGFSIEELNAFRAAAIDGTPSPLVAPVITYPVSNNMEFCYSDNESTSAVDGERYYARIIPLYGYYVDSVRVEMGGKDITSTAYSASDNTINIAKVTGEIIITATGAYIVAYTNRLATSIDTNGKIYNSCGYKDQTRLSSGGGDSSANGMSTTGYIACEKGDIIRLQGINHDTKGDTNHRIIFYTSTFAKTGEAIIQAGGTMSAQNYTEIGAVVDGSGYLTQFTVQPWSTSSSDTSDIMSSIAYFRICGYTFDSDAVITVNEHIY